MTFSFREILLGSLLLVLMLPGASAASRGDSTIHSFAPLYEYRSSADVDYSSLHLLGPIIKYENKADEYDLALRPLFYRSFAAEREASMVDLLFPVFHYKRDENRRSYSFLKLINYETQPDSVEDDSDFSIFPLVFYRKSASRPTSLSVFPIGGKVYDRLGRDEISYTLWPLYITSKKGETRARNYLWPFFATISGEHPDETGVKFWPLFGKAEYPGVYRKFFLLWPFWFKYDERLHTENPVRKRYSFPFYLSYESPKLTRRTVLWPFFSYLDDRGRGYTEWNYPWPFWQKAEGEFKHGWKFLPFASDMTRNDIRTRWVLWPLFKHENQAYEEITRRRFKFFFFVYRDLKETYIETGQARSRRTLAWPLFGYKREKGVSHFYTLALLEPLIPESEGVERNWSPFWRLYQKKWDSSGNSVTSFLWNLYWSERRTDASAGELFPLYSWHREKNAKHWSFLKGLLAYEHNTESGRRLKILYLPWGIPLGDHKTAIVE